MNSITTEKSRQEETTIFELQTCYSTNNSEFLVSLLYFRTPLFFNLYENRLIHFEFLEQIFRDLLEKKEMLIYNFQKRVFSLYLKKSNLSFYINLLGKHFRTISLITLTTLLLKSFPYRLFINENLNFFSLYKKIIVNQFNSIGSSSLFIFFKLIKKIKFILLLNTERYKKIFSKYKKRLLINYLKSIEVKSTLVKLSGEYKVLFTTLTNKQLAKLCKIVEKIIIILLIKYYLILDYSLKKSILSDNIYISSVRK
jgi:hypothetical protein